MNEKEQLILAHLRHDAWKSLATIAQSTNIPLSTVYDKIQRLQKRNVIFHWTALIDWKQLGYHHQATIALKIPYSQHEEFLSFLKKSPNVNNIVEINGGWSFLIDVIHINVKAHMAFMEKLQECFDIQELQEFQITNVLQQEMFFTDHSSLPVSKAGE